MRRTGALGFLALLFLISAWIGNSFMQVLTIFSIFMWVIAALLFVYLMLFKGMTLSIFDKGSRAPANDLDVNFEEDDRLQAVDASEDSSDGVVPFPTPQS